MKSGIKDVSGISESWHYTSTSQEQTTSQVALMSHRLSSTIATSIATSVCIKPGLTQPVIVLQLKRLHMVPPQYLGSHGSCLCNGLDWQHDEHSSQVL